MIADDVCPLCKTSSEDIEHLFFQCPVSQEIWTAILSSLQICRSVGTFSLELDEQTSTLIYKVYVMCFTETISHLWCSRNRVVFENQCIDNGLAAITLMFRVTSRCNDSMKAVLVR